MTVTVRLIQERSAQDNRNDAVKLICAAGAVSSFFFAADLFTTIFFDFFSLLAAFFLAAFAIATIIGISSFITHVELLPFLKKTKLDSMFGELFGE